MNTLFEILYEGLWCFHKKLLFKVQANHDRTKKVSKKQIDVQIIVLFASVYLYLHFYQDGIHDKI